MTKVCKIYPPASRPELPKRKLQLMNIEHRKEIINLCSLHESVKNQYRRAGIVLSGANSTVHMQYLGEANECHFSLHEILATLYLSDFEKSLLS